MTTATAPAATTTTTATVIVAPKALVTAVTGLFDLQVKVNDKFHGIADLVATECATHKYDRKQASTLVDAAFRSAIRLQGEKLGHKDDALTAYTDQVFKAKATDRSKVLGLAAPKRDTQEATTAARAEVVAAREMGVGVNRILEHVVRGEKTAAETAATPVNAKGARPNGNATPTTPATQPAAVTAAAAAKGETPKERFLNMLAATVAAGKALKLSLEDMASYSDEYFTEITTEAQGERAAAIAKDTQAAA